MSDPGLFPALPTQRAERPHRAKAIAAWGIDAPEWIIALADACDRKGQTEVARRIGYSQSVVTETLRKRYKGRSDGLEASVRGAYLGATVDCPVLGELPRDRCTAIQRQPFATSNPHRVMLAKACPACPECTLKRNGAAS